MSEINVKTGDTACPRLNSDLPIVIVLDRLRSAHNAGNIFRLADAVRAEKIFACGYTPAPPHPKLEKTAMGADKLVSCQVIDTAANAILSLKTQGYTIYGVDTAECAKLYSQTILKFPAAFVFGNEALGIAPEALSLCDEFICLPADGYKNSINVGNCAAVVLFEARRQFRKS